MVPVFQQSHRRILTVFITFQQNMSYWITTLWGHLLFRSTFSKSICLVTIFKVLYYTTVRWFVIYGISLRRLKRPHKADPTVWWWCWQQTPSQRKAVYPKLTRKYGWLTWIQRKVFIFLSITIAMHHGTLTEVPGVQSTRTSVWKSKDKHKRLLY